VRTWMMAMSSPCVKWVSLEYTHTSVCRPAEPKRLSHARGHLEARTRCLRRGREKGAGDRPQERALRFHGTAALAQLQLP